MIARGVIARVVRGVAPREALLLALAVAILAFVPAWLRGAPAPAPGGATYSSYDAAPGGYRAFFETLRRLGTRVDRFERRPAFLDETVDTLAYVDPPADDATQVVPTRADVDALEAWVRGGGRLLYVGDDDAAAAAGILHLPRTRDRTPRPRFATGARPRAGFAADAPPRGGFAAGVPSRGGFAAGARPPAAFVGVAASLRAAGVRRVSATQRRRWGALRSGMHVLVADALGPLVVAYAFGAGSVTAVVDRGLFSNAGIATDDRARLAAALARPARAGGLVAFDEVPHGHALPERWWAIVPRPLAIALAVAALALLLAFAGAAVRLGPPLVPPARDDRSSAEFLDALAALDERRGDVRGTLVDAAASTAHVVARALGLDATASNERIAAAIVRAGTRARFVRLQTIAANAYPGEANLVAGMALAQDLRKEFSTHVRSRI